MSQDKQTELNPQSWLLAAERETFFWAIFKHPTIGDWTFNLSLGRGQEVPLDYKGCWQMALPPSLKHGMEGKTTGVHV